MKTIVRFSVALLIALTMSVPAVPQQSAPTSTFLPAPQTPQKPTHERHPHIRGAIRELQEAKQELQTARHDFGGHREDAVKAVDEAIRQLRQALQYDKD